MQLGEAFKSKYMDEFFLKAWAFTFVISFHQFYYIYKSKLCEKQHTTYCWVYFHLDESMPKFTIYNKCKMFNGVYVVFRHTFHMDLPIVHLYNL